MLAPGEDKDCEEAEESTEVRLVREGAMAKVSPLWRASRSIHIQSQNFGTPYGSDYKLKHTQNELC
jgi:hypothetical protein